MKALNHWTISALLVITLGFSSNSDAALVGDTIFATGSGLGPSSATIGGGVEFTGINGFIDFDFDDNTLTLLGSPAYNNDNVGWSFFEWY